jgi:hypothetical protein
LGGDAAPEGGDDDVLLTSPGRREDDHTSHYKKGRKYERKDGRHDLRKGSARFRRETRATVAPESRRGRSHRSVAGSSVGAVGLPDLKALVGLEEQKQSIYNNSEKLMIESTMVTRRLVEQLEKKEAQKDET